MTNYLLSIDPSIKNTGFTLWEKRCHVIDCENNNCIELKLWTPIWLKSYDFKKYNTKYEVSKSDAIYNNNFIFLIKLEIEKLIKCHIGSLFYNNNFDLIIERGTFHSKNGIGYETQEHLRGFIAGQFNKLITKNMLISPRKWQNWYLNQENIIDTLIYNENENIGIANHPNNKWNKDLSIKIVNYLSIINNWNIKISNHDEADSLLIGWYYLNKDVK